MSSYQICRNNKSDGVDVHVLLKFNGMWASRIPVKVCGLANPVNGEELICKQEVGNSCSS